MAKKISIITISFNESKNLKRTISSVVNQTFQDHEYIVVDGGSTDDSLGTLKEYDKKIDKWISEPDKGIYDAMNKGLKLATGDYVLFMNSGDVFFDTDSLAKIRFEDHRDADIFYGETMIVNEAGKELGLRHKTLPHQLNWKHFRNGMVVCHQSILVKRELAPVYNLDYKLSADVEWVLTCLKRSEQIVFTNSIISRFLEGGASKKRHAESLKERFQIMRENFGLFTTLIRHFGFLVEQSLVKFGLRNHYRKNYLSKKRVSTSS